MIYLEWNNIISGYFFYNKNAGRDVHLFMSKEDIIDLAKNYFYEETEEEIWSNFLKALQRGLPGSNGNIISKTKYAYDKRNHARIDSIEIKYPPYIAYLVLLILPLIEGVDGTFSVNNYYDRLNRFLNQNQIKEQIGTSDFRNNQINLLWEDLEVWANYKNNGDLGLFKAIPFTNKSWVYVGKVFSQSIFPPKSIMRLPELFLEAGLIPDSTYTAAQFRKYLLDYASILQLSNSTLKAIQNSSSNELGQSIIEKAKKEYSKWTGESHSINDTGTTKRNDISSRIYLQMQVFNNDGKINFSFRMKSSNEFPEDLNFNGNLIKEEKGGYSKTMNLPFRDSFQLKDDFNKWIAKFPDKEVRLFISAGSLQFSMDYWIETDTLSKVNWMYLLCKKAKHDTILSWAKNHCLEFEDQSDFENMPNGYSLFKFLNPKEGIESIPELTIIAEKSIRLVSSLKYDFRTYTKDFLPEVEIVNSDGKEIVYIQFKNNENRLYLKKKDSDNNRWLVPKDISLFSDFNVRADGEIFSENETTYKIISPNDSAILIKDDKLPKRDSLGKITLENLNSYFIGSNVVGANLKVQIPYQHLFRGINVDFAVNLIQPSYSNSEGNTLLSFLTLKRTITAKDFYEAFEFLYLKYFENKPQKINFNFAIVKKVALNYFDYLGYLDYEYETKSIVINPPQLVFIPASKGREVLLIGGRDISLVNAIIETAPKYNLQVKITRQLSANEDLLLPDAITIKSFGTSIEFFGEKNLIALATKLNIKFNPEELVQVSLQHFCSDIKEYESKLFENNEVETTYENWARYIFNPNSFQLEQSVSEVIDKNFSLLEYRLRPWEYYHRIWVNQKCYSIDRNWGKYYFLYKLKKQVILKGNNKVAIPIQMPLPRLLFESIMLCSGIAPEIKYIEDVAYRIFENIPGMFITNLFHKLGQEPINNSIL